MVGRRRFADISRSLIKSLCLLIWKLLSDRINNARRFLDRIQVQTIQGLSVWCLSILPVSAWVFSGYSSFLPLRRHRLGGLEILGDVPSCMVVGVGGLLWKSSVSEYFLFESSHIQESLDLMALVSVIANLPIFKKKLIDYKMSICSLNSAL